MNPPIPFPNSPNRIGKGILNIGNTCYVNAILQMLSVLPEFQPFQPKSPMYKKRDKHPLFQQWNTLLQSLSPNPEWTLGIPSILSNIPTTPISTATPTSVTKEAIHPGIFLQTLYQHAKSKSFSSSSREPQDAAEFLQFLVEEFHQILAHPIHAEVQGQRENGKDDLAKVCYEMLAKTYQTSYSEFYPLCYGVTVSTLNLFSSVSNSPFKPPPSTPNISPVSLKPESFFFLHIPLPPCPPYQQNSPVTLYQCLEHMLTPELLDNENAWYDESVGYKRPVMKQTLFWNFPPILAITLQRLLPDGHKDNRVVRFPTKYLHLSQYVHGYNKEQYVYDLMGVCLHHGNLGGGHYTSFVQRTESQWVHYNDHIVQPLPEFPPETSDAMKQQEIEKLLHHPAAYCLLYRKIYHPNP